MKEQCTCGENMACSNCEKPLQQEDKCKDCSTHRKTANNGERYLCNHFSEPCKNCEVWVKKSYNICIECGASDSGKIVDFEEYDR